MKLLLGVNLTLFFLGMVMGSPVFGFLPFLAFLFLTSKLPNPENVTLCPFFSDDFTPLIREVNAFSA